MGSTAINASIASPIIGLETLLPSQISSVASAGRLGRRLQQEKLKKAPAPPLPAVSVSAQDFGGTVEAAVTVTGLASSPPRTSSFTSTRRVLAPSHCLSKTRRGRRRPGPGDGGEQDDDFSDGGGMDNNGNSGGDSNGKGDWSSDGDDGDGSLSESLWLWQALCLCSFLQAIHYVATGSKSREGSHVGALASLTYSFYNGNRAAVANCH